MKSVRGNPLVIKEVNTGIIRSALMEQGETTKKELSEETGLSVVTVTAILQSLMESREVFEVATKPSNGGRPSQTYRYNGNCRQALVVYAHQGGSEDVIKVRVVNAQKEILYQKNTYVQEVLLTTFEPLIEDVLEHFPAIGAIGFGLPGEEHNGIITVNDFKQLIGTKFLEHYQQKYGLPVIFENDANAATMGYCWKHQQMESSCIVGIYFLQKYPPGAGIVMNGKLYKGKNNYGGEIFKIPLGIDWHHRQGGVEETTEQIVKLAVTMSCVLAPEQIVIHSEPLGEHCEALVKKRYHEIMEEEFDTELIFSTEFEEEYEKGMTKITLELMENSIILTKEGRRT